MALPAPVEIQAKAAQNQLKALTGGAFACIMALLQFILADSLLRSTIITFLEFLKAQIALQKALLEATVAQLKVAVALLETEVSTAAALLGAVTGLGSRFPLDIFMRCPLTAAMVNAVSKGLAVSPKDNPIAIAKTKIRDLQYKIARMNQILDQTSASIEQCTLFTAQINAMEDLINAVADYPGQFTLPLP